ncbi:hypothetical protein V6U77_20995 [Micromonospora sp. CPCC 205546]|uniref:FtsX-like permease family protein n=1 Tax=Micromonospora echinofusca TaxID=47858 RepID=A0A1C5GBF2_MICEH|nr:hypothetical protein [Micromonospora echinofusca]SCG16446.1 hypothetical protein GA0070610_2711 [Micromonospora echinofusca]
MSSRVGGTALTVAFVRHRMAQVAVLTLLGFMLGGTVIGLAVARSSAEQAIQDSVRADIGGNRYALQTGDSAASKAIATVPDAMPVQDQTGDVLAGDLSAPVLVRAYTKPSLQLGIVIRGTRPRDAGELLLSESTAQALGIAIGDTVRVRTGDGQRPGRVVGLSVDPANRTTSTLVQLVAESAQFRPTIWLSDTDFYTVAALRPVLDQRTATYQSVDTVLEASAQNRPQFLSAMRFVPAGCGLLMGILLVAAGVVLSRRWRLDADALIAAGMPPALAWRRMLSVVCATVLAGEVLGGCAASTVLLLSRDPVSAWVGQQWVGIAIPWQEPVALLGLTILFALSAVPLTRLAARWAERRIPRPSQGRWATLAGALAVGLGLAALVLLTRLSLGPHGSHAAALVPLAAAVVAFALPSVVAPILCWGLPTATRTLMRHLLAGLRPVAATGAVVMVLSGYWSAQNTYDANVGEALSSPLEPAGSFVVSEMPDNSIEALAAFYRSHGGRQVVRYAIPDESKAQLRVTAPKVLTCMSSQRTLNPTEVTDCFPRESAAPLNRVMLGEPGSAPRADPHLLDNGKVGLLLFASGDGTATSLADTRAEADSQLGGNLPGLVVAPDSAVAKKFGLTANGTSEVLLPDFARLSPRDQFLVRAAAIRLAPSAQLASGTDPTAYDRLRSVANTASFLGATTAALILLLGGVALVVAHTLTRRTLVDIGAVPGRRWGIVARWTAVPLTTAALAIPLAIFTASGGGQRTEASYGSLWFLPGLLGAAASLIVGAAFLRPPPTADE